MMIKEQTQFFLNILS